MPDNVLYYGDNLDVLRRHVPAESVDLVYLDPPFNSDADYNVLFAEQVLISLEEATQPMRTEAAGAGFYHSIGWGKKYARLQLLTVRELLRGAQIDYPPSGQVNVTFR